MTPLEQMEALGLRTSCKIATIQDVRGAVELAPNPTNKARKMISAFVTESFEFLEEGDVFARLVSQYFFKYLLEDLHRDPLQALEQSQLDAVHYINNNQWMYVGTDADKSIKPENTKEKKLTLYDRALAFVDQNRDLPNKDIVRHFEKVFGMTKSGAQSYSHNVRSKLGMIERKS